MDQTPNTLSWLFGRAELGNLSINYRGETDFFFLPTEEPSLAGKGPRTQNKSQTRLKF